MNNQFACFPLWKNGIGLSKYSGKRQAFDLLYFKVYSQPDALPSFYIEYDSGAPCSVDIEVRDYRTDALVFVIESQNLPTKVYTNGTTQYLMYSGEPIASLDLPMDRPLYFTVGEYISEPFWTCCDNRVMFFEVTAEKKVGGVPYHMGNFTSRIGIAAQFGAPLQSVFEQMDSNERFGDTLIYQKSSDQYSVELQRVPEFLARFLMSLRLCDSVTITRDGSPLNFRGIDITVTAQKRNNPEYTLTLTASTVTFEFSDCDTSEQVTLLCEQEPREYDETEYDETEYA